MNLLIFGARGLTGRELVKQAVGRRHQVTAFIRSSSKLPLEHTDLKIIQGEREDANPFARYFVIPFVLRHPYADYNEDEKTL